MAKSADTKFSRYKKAGTETVNRIIANSVGEVGSGKTHFWLGAPGPILFQSLDLGLEGVVETYAADKDIYVAQYDMGASIGESFTVSKAKDARDQFIEDFEDALGKFRTIVWDRETDVFDLFYRAEFGTDDAYGAAPPKDWDLLKSKLRRMIALAKSTTINFGLIQGMKNEWVQTTSKNSGKKTATQSGNRVAKGMEDIDALVHMNLFHERQGKDFMVTVGKSRGPGGFDVQGETFGGVDFKTLAMMVFPDSTDEDWE
jgi:hypothetical protein